MEEKEKNIIDKICEETDKFMEEVLQDKLTYDNLDAIYKLVDIHKDLKNEEYWERKIEYMNYGNYSGYSGNYGNYGNYSGNYGRPGYNAYGDNYGRRGYDMKYRGDEQLERLSGDYGRYMQSRSYGDGEEADKSFHYMVKSLEGFIKVINEEAETPGQKQQLKEVLQKSMMQ